MVNLGVFSRSRSLALSFGPFFTRLLHFLLRALAASPSNTRQFSYVCWALLHHVYIQCSIMCLFGPLSFRSIFLDYLVLSFVLPFSLFHSRYSFKWCLVSLLAFIFEGSFYSSLLFLDCSVCCDGTIFMHVNVVNAPVYLVRN